MPTPDKAYAPATKPEEPELYHTHIDRQEPAHAAPAPSLEEAFDQQSVELPDSWARLAHWGLA